MDIESLGHMNALADRIKELEAENAKLLLHIHQQVWVPPTDEFLNKVYAIGIYFGYPECCINDFITDLKIGYNTKRRNFTDNETGFVPCRKHQDEIKEGKIKLSDLVQNRTCPSAFPSRQNEW